MVNRPAGGPRSQKYERADYDYYRESPRVVEQLLDGVDFGNDLIWDPCCGSGNVLDVAKRWGHPTHGSDIKDRHPRHKFIRGDILSQVKAMPRRDDRPTSVITNPPYSYKVDIAERIIVHILESYPVRRAAFIVPVAFINGQNRWGRILPRFRPSHIGIYMERHTMPPGHLIDSMPKPFEGGMADYVVIYFTRPHRWRTEAIWLKPGHHIPRHLRPGFSGGKHGA